MVAGLKAFHTIVSQMFVAMNSEILEKKIIKESNRCSRIDKNIYSKEKWLEVITINWFLH